MTLLIVTLVNVTVNSSELLRFIIKKYPRSQRDWLTRLPADGTLATGIKR